MKKILSLALALLISATLVIPAFAETAPGAPADPAYEEIRQFMSDPSEKTIAVPNEIRYVPRLYDTSSSARLRGILPGYVRSVQKIIDIDSVEIRQLAQDWGCQFDGTRLILGIRVLCNLQYGRELFLTQPAVLPK